LPLVSDGAETSDFGRST